MPRVGWALEPLPWWWGGGFCWWWWNVFVFHIKEGFYCWKSFSIFWFSPQRPRTPLSQSLSLKYAPPTGGESPPLLLSGQSRWWWCCFWWWWWWPWWLKKTWEGCDNLLDTRVPHIQLSDRVLFVRVAEVDEHLAEKDAPTVVLVIFVANLIVIVMNSSW